MTVKGFIVTIEDPTTHERETRAIVSADHLSKARAYEIAATQFRRRHELPTNHQLTSVEIRPPRVGETVKLPTCEWSGWTGEWHKDGDTFTYTPGDTFLDSGDCPNMAHDDGLCSKHFHHEKMVNRYAQEATA